MRTGDLERALASVEARVLMAGSRRLAKGREALGSRATSMTKIEKTTDELLEIVGSQRSSYSAEVVAEAERTLKARTASAAELFRAKLQRIGTICAVLGGLGCFWGLAMAILGLTLFADSSHRESEDFVFRHFGAFYVGTAVSEAIAGAALLAGGLYLRRLRDRGRRLVAAVLWLAMTYVVTFTAFWVLSLLSRAQGDAGVVVMAVAGAAMSGVWLFVLWLPLRFFRSAKVRDACTPALHVRT